MPQKKGRPLKYKKYYEEHGKYYDKYADMQRIAISNSVKKRLDKVKKDMKAPSFNKVIDYLLDKK